MSLTHLGCPFCGGTVSLAEGQRLVACRYCGREALALVPEAMPRYVVPPGVDRAGAAAAARAALSRGALPARLRRGAVAAEWTLCYVPFYEVTGTRVGTFLERETVVEEPPEEDRRRQGILLQFPQQEKRRTERTDTRVVEAGFLRVMAACDVADLGLEQIPLREMRAERGALLLEPFDLVALQSRAVVFAPGRPPQHAPTPARPDGRMRVVEEQVKILYYPVWHGRYPYAGRMYGVAVDGVRGAVLDGHAPLDRSQAAWLLAAALGVGALAWSRLLHGLVSAGRLRAPVLTLDSALGGIVLALLGGAALVVATAAFRMFRRGGALRWAAQEGVWLSDAASRGVLGMLSGALFTGVQGGGRE